MNEEITFVNFRKEQRLELIKLWRKSFAHAMGIKEDTREEVVNEHLAYLHTYNPEIIRVAVEKNENKVVGFMAKEGNIIKDLFIHVEYQRRGLGSSFIQKAKEEEEFLTLSTFESNKRAQKFYEFHDFKIVRRGFAGLEGNSWANNQEQLADITYEWKRVTKLGGRR
jgi:ribosomal protein S18 acetylase RimI-like enzyme